MKITVVRHGETNYNVAGLVSALPGEKVHLTDEGISQIEKVSKELENEKFDIIIVSEMFRTQQTAGIINNPHQLFMIIDSRINEFFSDFEDKHFDEVRKEYIDKDWYTHRHGEGESIEDVKVRVYNFLDELRTKKQFKSILIVTHEIILKFAKAYSEKLNPETADKTLHFKNGECFSFYLE